MNGKGKKVSSSTPCKDRLVARGANPIIKVLDSMGTSGPTAPKKPMKWHSRAKGHRYLYMFLTRNVSIVNPIMQKLHALGFILQYNVSNPQVVKISLTGK